MVSERNRIINIINFLESLDIKINLGKNKARGNKGFFSSKADIFRIDIAKGLSEKESLRVLVHEFAHFIHYKHDKTLKTLDFLLNPFTDEMLEELLQLTVDSIPKETIKPLFNTKEALINEINELERKNFNIITNLELKTKLKLLNRINARISKINRYYNSPTELFARSMEVFMLDNKAFKLKAPILYTIYSDFISNKKDSVLTDFFNICHNN